MSAKTRSSTHFDPFETLGSSAKSRKVRTPTSDMGVRQYIRDCNKYGAIPANFFLRHVDNDYFSMRFYGLGPLGAKALSGPLETNTHIRTLDLEGNCIGNKGAFYLASSLRDNVFITSLNVADNKIRRQGAAAIIEMMRENGTITSLDLSSNDIPDRDGYIFYYLLRHNHSLKRLAIGHNALSDVTAKWLQEAFEINDTLTSIDLSWNLFRLKAITILGELLLDNTSLREFYLSMNGMGTDGARLFARVLVNNVYLQVLDVSANRITTDGAAFFAKALETNETLKVLKIGRNPITPVGAMYLLKAVETNESSVLELLDLEGVPVSMEFEELEIKLCKERKLKVIHGKILAKRPKFKVKAPCPDLEVVYKDDPMTKLRQYCNKRQIRMLDLFKRFDKDGSWSVTKDELIKGIKSTGIDMCDMELGILINKLDKDSDGDIDYREIAQGDTENKRERIKADQWNRQQKKKLEEYKKAISDVSDA